MKFKSIEPCWKSINSFNVLFYQFFDLNADFLSDVSSNCTFVCYVGNDKGFTFFFSFHKGPVKNPSRHLLAQS